MRQGWALLPAALLLLLLGATIPARPTIERTVWDRVYSEPQALRGEAVYARGCESCHQATLMGADQTPALVGSGFVAKWDGMTLAQMHDRISRTMPTTAPGTLSRTEVSELIAFLLSVNEFPSGAQELPVAPDSLAEIRFLATPRAKPVP